MRIDLFELVDGLIRGVVFFFYNIIQTVGTIVRHPIIGPTQLYRWSLHQNRRQIGGLTFLFITFLLFYSALPLPTDGFFRKAVTRPSPNVLELTNVWIHVPQFDMDRMWPAILGSLISTVAIDGSLRVIMMWRLPKRRAWRAMMLASAEYSFLWIFAALTVGFWLLGSDGQFGVAKALLAIALMSLGALPPAAILRRAMRQRGQLERFSQLFAWIFEVIGTFVLAILLGSFASFGVQLGRIWVADAGPKATVETLNCTVRTDARTEAYGIVSLEGSAVRALEPSDFELGIRPQAIGLEPELFIGTDPAWADPASARYVLFNQSAPRLVRLTFQTPPELAGEAGEHDCDMTIAPKGKAFQH